MAVGKGSMARASKAVESTSEAKESKVAAEKAVTTEPATAEAVEVKETAKKTTTARTKRTTAKKTATKTTAKKAEVTASSVITGTSKEVLQAIEYQKSYQVLDREPEENETFGVGEAMPIYFF